MMKRFLACLLVLILCCSISMATIAEEVDLSGLNDEALTALYQLIRQEMIKRGLTGQKTYEIPEGKYIIGQDIIPGTYILTCTGTEGQSMERAYSSLGSLFGALGDDEGEAYEGLFNSLGGMMSDYNATEVKIIGDYGTIIKSYSLKADQTVQIILEEETALQIESGTCTLTPVE